MKIQFEAPGYWKFTVVVTNGVIIDCDKLPNDQPHWCIGKSIDYLRNYYAESNNPKIIETIL